MDNASEEFDRAEVTGNITVYVDVRFGYDFEGPEYIDFILKNANLIDYHNGESGLCIQAVAEVPYPFADVKIDKGWEYPYVKYVYEKGYMTGKGSKLDPKGMTRRSEWTAMLKGFDVWVMLD